MNRPEDPSSTSPVNWSRLGLGTGTLASLGRAASVAQVRSLLDAMEELGIRAIDTADTYGSGDCEHLLARALSGRRDRFHIITKAGYRHGNLPGPLRPLNQFVKKALNALGQRQCFEIPYLARCLDQSLRRLRTDHVEAFLLHDPPARAVASHGLAEFLERIRKAGKTLLTGVSSGDPEVLRLAVEGGFCQLIESPCNLRTASALSSSWTSCAERAIHVLGNHVYEPGCLGLQGMTHELLMRASAALLPAGATILCGTRNPEHLRSSFKWALDPLNPDETQRLCALAARS